MKRVLVVMLLLVVVAAPVYCLAQDEQSPHNNDEITRYKDPIFAGALSWYVPGLGQIYAGSIAKGVTFLAVEFALLYGTIISVAEVEIGVTGGFTLGIKVTGKGSDVSSSERTTAIVLGTTLIVVHFINVVDAVNTARRFNSELNQKIRPDVTYDPELKSYNFGITGHF
jgi:TM2 domain-containing membrane protein YozV